MWGRAWMTTFTKQKFATEKMGGEGRKEDNLTDGYMGSDGRS